MEAECKNAKGWIGPVSALQSKLYVDFTTDQGAEAAADSIVNEFRKQVSETVSERLKEPQPPKRPLSLTQLRENKKSFVMLLLLLLPLLILM
jgi:tRNA uridine 5-carbamoylmethylation protein Kti12